MAFYLVKFVSRNMLAIKNKQIVIENVSLDDGSEIASPTRGDAVCRTWDDTLVCLHVVVETTEVSSKLLVLDLSSLLVFEHKQVLVQVFTIVLLLCSCLQTTFQDFHQLFWLSLVGSLLI